VGHEKTRIIWYRSWKRLETHTRRV
jgi:hypothetical protein